MPCLFANSFGICLSGFLDTSADCTSNTPPSPSSATQFKARSSSTTLAPLAALAVLPLLALLAWYIRRQRRETRKRTAEFADQLDKHEVNKRLDVLAADEELERKKRRGLKDLWLKNKARVALPRSHEEGQTGREQRSPPLAQARPEAVHMQDFSKRSSYSNEIGQDPASLEPSQGSNFSPPVSARWPGMNGNSMGAPSSAPSTIPPRRQRQAWTSHTSGLIWLRDPTPCSSDDPMQIRPRSTRRGAWSDETLTQMQCFGRLTTASAAEQHF